MVNPQTRSAPVCSSTSATSVCPFSHAYVRAVSPVAVVAWTLAPEQREKKCEHCFIGRRKKFQELHRKQSLTCSQQVFDQLQMPLLCSLHEWGGTTQLNVRPSFDEEISHL